MKKIILNIKKNIITLFALFTLIPIFSNAGTYWCAGYVTQVTTDLSGNVNAGFNFLAVNGLNAGQMPWQYICNVATTQNGIDPNSCKAIVSTLTAAHVSNNIVEMWFNNSTNSSCNAAGWNNIGAMGWYFGPSIQ